MSAVPHAPRRALDGVFVRVRIAPLALIVTAGAAFRIATAWLRPTPYYFPDEYMYASISRSLASGHAPVVRGVPAHFFPLLQPLLTAPAWLLPNVEEAYRATQAIESVVMSLAAVPVYYLARRLDLPHRSALAAAGLSLAIPAAVYSSFVLSEPVAYPVALGAIAAAVHAIDRPGARSFALFLGLAALAMFARMQFAVLLPCFVVTLVAVALRERRLRTFVRSHRIAIALFLLVGGALVALGPARNTGYYPSFTFTPGFKASTALHLIAPDALVLAFAGGFVLVPGAILGVVFALVRPLQRAELAFAAMTTVLTVGVFAESIVYGHPNNAQARIIGHTDFVQERYLFYLLPLWTIAFLLYARRGYPRKGLHAIVAVALVVASLRLPLAGYVAGDGFDHSPFLFALRQLAEMVHSAATASLIIVLAGAAAVVVLLAVSFLAPRALTAAVLVVAGAATAAGSAGAISLNARMSRALYDIALDRNPSAIDAAGSGHATMVLFPGTLDADALLFWNPSIDRLALLPGTNEPDTFAVEPASVARDGTLLVNGARSRGDILLSTSPGSLHLQNGTTLYANTGLLFVRARDGLRFHYVIAGRDPDGWLEGRGSITVWPSHGRVDGRLVLSIRAPRNGRTLTIRFTSALVQPIVRRIGAGRSAVIDIPLCSRAPVTIAYAAAPMTVLPDGRIVAAMLGATNLNAAAGGRPACSRAPAP